MSRLGPYQENTIVVGDCLDVMAQMPDGCVDLVVTDPPYGYGRLKDGDGRIEAIALVEKAFVECYRILRNGAIFITFGGTGLLNHWLRAIDNSGLQFLRALWMYKPADMTYPWRGWLLKSEAILLASHGKADNWNIEDHTHDVYEHRWVGKEGVEGHPTVKPSWVVKDLIRKTSFAGDLIFDPFIGSGTTAVVADRLGRKFFGCEINPDYVEMALERLEKDRAGRQLSLL